jgi:multidrug transporter EmrE-like cation transporter
VLGVAMLVTAMLRVRGGRIMLLIFGWAAAFWMLVAAQHDSSISTRTFGPGWYCSWVGIGLILILSMGVPLWQQLRQRRAA